ncbi:pilus assembly protein [Blastopirellula sp. J2-11]|uniref:TadE family protein n=1 Tax=Blastopirellula sp. J2-11 TaxID=2943192 RepID=UPI0021C79873|nr:TadE family protein [Blastopirellula sp. J2-11]UUO07228.1 pilus assembly protein [Blastopirellula sp. J2-11]
MNHAKRTAAAAIELAVCLPLLITITIFTVDAANVQYAKITLDNAVRNGVHRGATMQFTPFTYESWSDISEQTIRQEMEIMPDFESQNFQVNVEAIEQDDRVTVIATATYQISTLFNWSGMGTEVTLARQYEMRQVR